MLDLGERGRRRVEVMTEYVVVDVAVTALERECVGGE